MDVFNITSIVSSFIFIGSRNIKPYSSAEILVADCTLEDLRIIKRLYDFLRIIMDIEAYDFLKQLLNEKEDAVLLLKEDKSNKVNNIVNKSPIEYPTTGAVSDFVDKIKTEIFNELATKENKLYSVLPESVEVEQGLPLYRLGKNGDYVLCDPDFWYTIDDNYVIPVYLKTKIKM